MKNKKTIIFDIDGTLADISARRQYLTPGPDGKKDWDKFNSGYLDDAPNTPIVELFKMIAETGNYRIVITTGRPESAREETKRWLFKHGLLWAEELHFRKNGDRRPDWVIKKEILDLLREEGHDILFAVDDRQQVVDTWRKNGVTCLQCAPGDF